MGKRSNNNSATDKVVIESADVELLMRSERWHDLSSASTSQDAPTGVSAVAAEMCRVPHLDAKNVDIAKLTEVTADDIIDRFLRSDNYRIVAEEDGPAEEILTEAEFSGEDDLVSEELAEVYLAQGLKDMAKETYRKLSLLNPEKSVYFAELIAKLDSPGAVRGAEGAAKGTEEGAAKGAKEGADGAAKVAENGDANGTEEVAVKEAEDGAAKGADEVADESVKNAEACGPEEAEKVAEAADEAADVRAEVNSEVKNN